MTGRIGRSSMSLNSASLINVGLVSCRSKSDNGFVAITFPIKYS